MDKDDRWDKVKCDLLSQKAAFIKLHSKKLKCKLKKPIMKRDKVKIKDLYEVAKDIDIFDNDTAMKLSKYLYIKMVDDKEKVRPWKCQTCHFLNCKLMVGGLWRYYNQTNKCGLCGDYRDVVTVDEKDNNNQVLRPQLRKRTTMAFLPSYKSNVTLVNPTNKPEIDTQKWEEIELECKLFKSTEHLASNQLIFLMENYFIDKISTLKYKKLLDEKKEQICEYFMQNKMTGKKCVDMRRLTFANKIYTYLKAENKKLKPALHNLFKTITEFDSTQIINLPKPEQRNDDDDDDDKDDEDLYRTIKSKCPALQKSIFYYKNLEK